MNTSALLDIPTPDSHHAFLSTQATVHDPGKGDLIDLQLPSGLYLRGQAGIEVLRLLPNINGIWRATLHFETFPDGEIREPLKVPRLRSITPDLQFTQPTWSAAGKIVRLDRADGVVVIRVYPSKITVQPFVISAIASLEQLSSIENSSGVKLKGTLRDRYLVVSTLEPIPLGIPKHWNSWKPPLRQRNLEEFTANQRTQQVECHPLTESNLI